MGRTLAVAVSLLACLLQAPVAWGQTVRSTPVGKVGQVRTGPVVPLSGAGALGTASGPLLSPAGSVGLAPSALPGRAPAVLPRPAPAPFDATPPARAPGLPPTAAAPAEEPGAVSARGPPQDGPQAPAAPRLLESAAEQAGTAATDADKAPDQAAQSLGALWDGGPRGEAAAAAEPRLRIVMAASEAVPFIKTGGLADVVGSLSRALADAGHQVTLVLPKYKSLRVGDSTLERVPGEFQVSMGPDCVKTARLYKTRTGGVDVYLVEQDKLFGGDKVYGYYDDDRFIFFSRAVVEAVRFLGLKTDVFHAHDWHTALIPALLKGPYKDDPLLSGAASVLSLHNLAFQGSFAAAKILTAGFGWEDLRFDRFEQYGNFNLLKAGLLTADKLATVSKTYVQETMSREFGAGLEEVLRSRRQDYSGIVNGVDQEEWDPTNDPLLARRYGPADAAAGKAANKAALQARYGLKVDPKVPLFAAVSRISWQKGLDAISELVPDFIHTGAQLVVVGSAHPEDEQGMAVERTFQEWARRYPGQIVFHPFDLDLPHVLYAASDFFLMPSRFEPCGLTQQFAMLYGSLPIVSNVGGLADTVMDGKTGIVIHSPSSSALWHGILRALGLYKSGKLSALVADAMLRDPSWAAAVPEYIRLYHQAMRAVEE
ncbi:MAG: glycogen/starch synthase [Elusimicrobia bacterium]|nr:glycogen/starch synthase [Elusimicrobiota bacterium]